MNSEQTKNRFYRIFSNYRKDYKPKYLLELKADSMDDGPEKDEILVRIKKCEFDLKEKYRLVRLISPEDPSKVIDADFNNPMFMPVIEKISHDKEGNSLTIRIDLSYSLTEIRKAVDDMVKDTFLERDGKVNRAGRPSRVDEGKVRETAKHMHEHYRRLRKLIERNPDTNALDEELKKKVNITNDSDLVLEELKSIYPQLEETTLTEYAKPYQETKSKKEK